MSEKKKTKLTKQEELMKSDLRPLKTSRDIEILENESVTSKKFKKEHSECDKKAVGTGGSASTPDLIEINDLDISQNSDSTIDLSSSSPNTHITVDLSSSEDDPFYLPPEVLRNLQKELACVDFIPPDRAAEIWGKICQDAASRVVISVHLVIQVEMSERIVVLLDMDCFYVQVEERHYPHIKGCPAAVVQYNTWKGGGIIAVNYEARAFGVKRGMRGDEARSKCPDIQLVQVPINRGKADLTRYRDAGKEVISVLCDFSDCVERASIDEAYIDLTNTVQEKITQLVENKIGMDELKSTWVVGHDQVNNDASNEEKEEARKQGAQEWLSSLYGDEEEQDLPLNDSHPHWDDIRLATAAVICEKMRAAVFEHTGFKCSAGIAHNKMLGKLSCGLHKPNQQTVLPQREVKTLWQTLPVGKIRNLGGKLGDTLTEELGCNTMGDLASISLMQLMGRYDNKTANWLYNLGKGKDTEPVTSRQLPKSIGCGKNFQGKEALNTKDKVQKWMLSLAEELSERLHIDQTANKRRAKTLTVSVRLDGDDRFTSMSRSSNLPSYCAERIARVALSLIQHTNKVSSNSSLWSPSVKNISLSAGKFEDWTSSGSADIQEMFKKAKQNSRHHETGSVYNSPKKTPEKTAVAVNKQQVGLIKIDCNDTVQKTKVAKSSKSSPKQSNSFFKNFLLKRESHSEKTVNTACSNKVNEPEVSNGGVISHEETYESDNESMESANLDVLVSCLSEDEENCNDETEKDDGYEKMDEDDSSDSVYDAFTDIDSSGSSKDRNVLQDSPDLFSEGSIDEPISVNAAPLKKIAFKQNFENKSVRSETGGTRILNENGNDSEAVPKVSVEELFPDLDNFDESLLSILPKDMKHEVQKALKLHKSKSHHKKSGLWKYVTSNPSPQKEMCKSPVKALVPSVTSRLVNDKCESVAGPSAVKEESNAFHFTSNDDANGNTEDSTHFQVCQKISPKLGDGYKNDTSNFSEKEQVVEDVIQCDLCGLKLSVFEMPEHKDYHVALNLQNDIKNESINFNRGLSGKYSAKNDNVRGRKRSKGTYKTPRTPIKDCKIQKIDSFFKS